MTRRDAAQAVGQWIAGQGIAEGVREQDRPQNHGEANDILREVMKEIDGRTRGCRTESSCPGWADAPQVRPCLVHASAFSCSRVLKAGLWMSDDERPPVASAVARQGTNIVSVDLADAFGQVVSWPAVDCTTRPNAMAVTMPRTAANA